MPTYQTEQKFLSLQRPKVIFYHHYIFKQIKFLYKGSGNEREIFYVMLDKSTYLKKTSLIQFTECIFHVFYPAIVVFRTPRG